MEKVIPFLGGTLKTIGVVASSLLLTTTCTFDSVAREAVPPKGPPAQLPASLDDIEDCANPVVMLVVGEVTEIGFDWEHPSGRDYGEELRNSGLYERFGGFYMTSNTILETFENPYSSNRFTLMAEWPCLEAAQGFYYSPEYQDILKLRAGSGTFQFTVFPKETLEDMDYMSER